MNRKEQIEREGRGEKEREEEGVQEERGGISGRSRRKKRIRRKGGREIGEEGGGGEKGGELRGEGGRQKEQAKGGETEGEQQELEITSAPEIFIKIEKGRRLWRGEGELQCLIAGELASDWTSEPPNRKVSGDSGHLEPGRRGLCSQSRPLHHQSRGLEMMGMANR